MSKSQKDSEITFHYNSELHKAQCTLMICEFRTGGAVAEIVYGHYSLDELRILAHHVALRNTITGPDAGGAIIQINCSPDNRKAAFTEFVQQIESFKSSGLTIISTGLNDGIVNDRRFLPSDSAVPVYELIEAWSIAETARHFYNFWGGNMTGKRLVVCDWNKTTACAAYYLSKHSASLVGFHNKGKFYYRPNGWTVDEIETLLQLENSGTEYEVKSEIFLEELTRGGSEIILGHSQPIGQAIGNACLNQGFELWLDCDELRQVKSAESLNYLEQLDSKTAVLPTFVCTSGPARMSLLHEQKKYFEDGREYLMDTSQMLEAAIMKIHQFNVKPQGIRKKAIDLAEKMLDVSS